MINAFLESWSHESTEYPIIDVGKCGQYHNNNTTRKRMWVNARVRNLCMISVPYKSSCDAQDDERVLHTDGNRTSDISGISTQGNLFAIATLHNGIYKLHGMHGHVPAECAWGNWHQRFGHERVKGLQHFQSERCRADSAVECILMLDYLLYCYLPLLPTYLTLAFVGLCSLLSKLFSVDILLASQE